MYEKLGEVFITQIQDQKCNEWTDGWTNRLEQILMPTDSESWGHTKKLTY